MRAFFNRLEENIIALLLVSMTLLVFTESILRFGFGQGLLWAQELTLHLSAWLVLFGMSYVLKNGGHIGVDSFVKAFSTQTQRILTLLAVTASILYCGLLAYGAWIYLQKMHLIGIELDDISIPKWIAHSILFIGFLLLSLRFFEVIINVLKGKQTLLNAHNEAADGIEFIENSANPSSKSEKTK